MRNLLLTGGIGHPFADAAPALAAILDAVGIRSEVTTDIEGGLARLASGGFDLASSRLVLVNVPLALVPRVVTAPMQTTMMRASMTAYSTAVGPSSRLMKLTTASVNLRIGLSFL